MATSSFSSEGKVSLNSVGSLFSDAWKLYENQFAAFTQMLLPPAILLAVGSILKIFPSLIVIVIGSIFTFAGVLVAIIAAAAIIYSLRHRTGFDASYRAAKKLFWSLVWIAILVGFATVGGFVMLIVPGIWLGVGLTFSSYLLVLEGKRGMNALAQSREYVKGYWWAIFGRILLLIIPIIVIEVIVEIPFTLVGGAAGHALASAIILLFTTPFSIAYSYTVYQNLAVLKPHLREEQATAGKTLIAVAQLVAIIFFILLAFGFVAASVLGLPSNRMQYNGYPGYGYPGQRM